MQLTSFQVSQLQRLLNGEQPLAKFCDNIEGERLCWSGLVGIRAAADALRATVAISDRGRAALQPYLA